MKKIATTAQPHSMFRKIALSILIPVLVWGNAFAATYYSTATGSQNLTTLSFWKPNRNGTGTSPANFTSGDIFVIQGTGGGSGAPHSINSTTAWSISGTNSKLQVESGATLQSNAAITLAAATTFQVDNGGVYNHNNTGTPSSTIYQGTESFGAGSTVNILQWINNSTVLTTGVTLPFGNLTINNSTFSTAWNQSWSGAINLCAGNFTITTTGGGQFRFTGTGTTTVTVGGNYSQAADAVSFANGAGANVTFNVGGDFTLSGSVNFILTDGNTSIGNANVTGTTNLATTGTAGIRLVNSGNAGTTGTFQTTNLSATGTSSRLVDFGAAGVSDFRIDGNFTKSGTGAFYTTSLSQIGQITFNKPGKNTFSYSGTNSDYTSYIVSAGDTLQMLTGLTVGPSNSTIPASFFNVNGNLDCGAFTITAGGTNESFTLASGGTLTTSNTNGVVSTTVGSVSTAITSTFNVAANYIFNGTSAQQTKFKAAAQAMNNLTITNSAGVSLNTTATVNGTLFLTTGAFTLSTALTMGAGATINRDIGSLSAAPTFGATVNVTYSGTTAVVSGPELPASTTVLSALTMNKSGGITLNANVTANGTSTFTSGIITTGANALTIAAAGSISGASSSSYVSGILKRVFSATGTKNFPVGKGGVYRPLDFNYTALTGTSTVSVEQFESALTGSLSANTNLNNSRYWDISQAGGSSLSYKVTLNNTGDNLTGTVRMLKKESSVITSNAATGSSPNFTNTAAYSGMTGTVSHTTGSDCTVSSSAGSDQTGASTCGLTDVAMGGNTPAFGGGAWSVLTGTGGSFGAPSSPSSTFSGTAGNTYQLQWLITNGNCNSASTVNVKFNLVPAASSGDNGITTICSNSSYTVANASVTNSASFSWSSSSGNSAGFTSTTALNPTYTPNATDISNGTVTITLTAVNSPCTNATSSKVLTIVAAPSASAGSAMSTCSNSGAINITGGSGASNNNGITWSTPNGTGSFANANSLTTATYTPSGADITAGSVTITLTATGNSPCGNATSNKTLTITAAPSANAGSAISTCSNSGAINITGGSGASNNNGITWSTPDGTGGFANANSLTTATYTPSGADITAGSVTITLTATGNSPCGNATSNKTLTITAAPSASAGSAMSTCSNAGTINITGGSNASNNSGITWSTPDGTGSFANANSLTTATYTPSAADITAGSVTITLTAGGNSPCTNAASNKTLTIITEPSATAGGALTACSNAGAINITGGSGASNNNGITWSTPDGTGSFANANSLTTATYTPSGADVTAGSVTITLTATGNSPCADATSNKTLTLIAEPTTGAGSDDAICYGNNFNTSATASNYNSISWGTSGTGTFTNGNSLNATYTPSTADSTAGSVVLTITTTGNSPCSVASDNLTLTINAAPTNATVSTISGAAEACSGQITLMTSNITGGSGFTYSWNVTTNPSVVLFSTSPSGPFTAGPFNTSANTVYAQFGNVVGSGYNVCTQLSNLCGTAANKCDWIRGKVGTPGTIIGSSVACPSNVKTYDCGVSGGATVYTWTLAGSTIPITSGQGTNSNVQVTFPPAFTSGQLCVTASLSCGGSSASAPRCMTVSNTPVVPGAFTSGPPRVCPGQTNVLYTVPASNFASGYNWTVPVGAAIVETPPYGTSIHVNFPNPYNGAPPVCVYATSGCSSSPGRCKTVGTNKPGQPGQMSGPVNNVCNSMVQYSVSFDPLATGYTWTIPAGATNIVQNGPVIQFTMPGNFTNGQVSVVANTSACTPGNSQARTINVSGAPPTPGSITPNPVTWCSGSTVNFSTPVISPLPNYVWSVSNGTLDAGQGTNNIDVITANQGTVVVQVRAGNTCGLSQNKVLHSSPGCRIEGGQLKADDAQLTLYPNPAHDRLTIEINNSIEEDALVNITDLAGKLISAEHTQLAEGITTLEIDLGHYAKGAYMITIEKGGSIERQRFMVQ